MKTTINLDNELLAKAQSFTGIKEKSRLIHMGLEALIQREAALRLAERPRARKRADASGVPGRQTVDIF